MRNFQYFRPTTADQTVALLEARFGNTEVLAGGTDLLALQKDYIAQPGRVISLNGVAALKAAPTIGDRVVTLNAGMTLADIADHPRLKQFYPSLTEAADLIGGPQIKNMGTLGGNLCQRNRCWYFRDEHTPCLLKGGKLCYAIEGENKYHALFAGNHQCVIVSPSTLAPALIALGATAEIQSPSGKKTIELAKFFKAPASAVDREHVLAANELVLSVAIPNAGANNATYEVRQRQSHDWPLVQASVAFQGGKNGAVASAVKVVLGHVAPIPHIAEEASKYLEGKAITDATATEAGKLAAAGAKPLSQTGYKVKLVEVAVKRALMTAAGLPKYWEA